MPHSIFFPHHQFVETKRSPPTTSNPFNKRGKEANKPGDFILSSLAIALVLHTLSNRLLIPTSPNSQLSDSKFEYAYSFDVAVNSFFPAFLTIHLGLILMAGALVRDNWVCLFVGKYVFPFFSRYYLPFPLEPFPHQHLRCEGTGQMIRRQG